MEVEVMTVRSWADSNLQRGYNLNSDKLKSFASAIDDEINKSGNLLQKTILLGPNLPYECEQTLVSPGGTPLFEMLRSDRLYTKKQSGTTEQKKASWNEIKTKEPLKFMGAYGSPYGGSKYLDYFIMYQACTDGGYNIFHVNSDSQATFKLFEMTQSAVGSVNGKEVSYGSIDAIRTMGDSSRPVGFKVIGAPIDGLMLGLATPGRDGRFFNSSTYYGGDFNTTLYTVTTNQKYSDMDSTMTELFLDVNINLGLEQYNDNPHRLRRYNMTIKGGYIRVTKFGSETTKFYRLRH